MKQKLMMSILFLLVSAAMFAEGIYFDGGIGIGKPATKIDGNDVSESLEIFNVDEIGVGLGLKLGYGPIAGTPIYIAGVLEGIGHRFYNGDNYIQYSSYLAGPSIIFYPVSSLQISSSAGFSWVANDSEIIGWSASSESKSGYAYDISAAVDLGESNHGLLLGVKFFQAVNILEASEAKEVSSLISIFVKYAYRHNP